MIFKKDTNFLFLKEKRENKIKIQFPPIFKKKPGKKQPFILTNISNLRIRKIIAKKKKIDNILFLFNFTITSE